MNVQHPVPAVKDEPAPPSRRALLRAYPALAATAAHHLKFRLRVTWRDPSTPSGQREELIHLDSPKAVLSVLRKITATPSRPLVAVRIEARTKPYWAEVPVEFVEWKLEQRERRAAERAATAKGGAR